MAVIITGSIVSDIRGSVGTETYSRGQGGLYVKARKGPTDNTGPNRDQCRATMTALSQAWSATLTETQRAAWRKYAHQHPLPNRWGVPHLVSGYTRFIQLNFYRHRLDAAIPFADPPVAAHLHPPAFTFTADATADTITIALPPANYDPPFANLELFAYGGDNISPGRNYYSTPWQYIHRNEFNGAWTHDPWTIAYPLDLVATFKVFIKIIAQKSDTGELSRPHQASAIITA